eukprot:TRINITY_DN67507_c4_g1_i1.p1 TRINITY_DN67507_c4_g1~~TRINITY_DN67507_c4_g1_i1.p1  ORF type:complete len:656 (+),score=150.22 TRINITY_DN67507_c4_g1_i1:52-2019(+)
MPLLFDDADDGEIVVDPQYHKKYAMEQKKRDLQELSRKHVQINDIGEEDESEYSEEDEDGEVVEGSDRWLAQVVVAARSKDRTQLNKLARDPSESLAVTPATAEAKPVTVSDLLVKQLAQGAEVAARADEVEEEQLTKAQRDRMKKNQQGRTAEVEGILASLKDEDDGMDFVPRKKTEEELQTEEKEFVQFAQSDRGKKFASEQQKKFELESIWAGQENLNENEKFLRDFFQQEGWKAKALKTPTYEEIIGAEKNRQQDEDFHEQQEEWEQKYEENKDVYQFHHQEAGSATVASFPRQPEGLLRKPDTRNQEARERKKQAKQATIDHASEEIKRLKALKKEQIAERVSRIQKASGANLDFTAKEIMEWDMDQLDQHMNKVFDEKYDQEADDDFHPDEEGDDWDLEKQLNELLGEEAATLPPMQGELGEEWRKEAAAEEPPKKKKKLKKSKSFGKKHEKAPLEEPVLTEEGDLDVTAEKKKLKKDLADYDKYDFDDILADGTKTRFRYTKTTPESFGLQPWEILQFPDRQLNKICPIKFLAPYKSKQEVLRCKAVVGEQLAAGLAAKPQTASKTKKYRTVDSMSDETLLELAKKLGVVKEDEQVGFSDVSEEEEPDDRKVFKNAQERKSFMKMKKRPRGPRKSKKRKLAEQQEEVK